MMMMMMMLPGRQSGVARQSEKYVRASAHLPCCLRVFIVDYDQDDDDDDGGDDGDDDGDGDDNGYEDYKDSKHLPLCLKYLNDNEQLAH